MKLDQQQQAQKLYMQTGLSKSEIAEAVGVSLRTVQYWAQQYNWDRLKMNAQHMPIMLAENCYHAMGRFMDHLMSPERADDPITPPEANMLYKLMLTIEKLKKHTTTNEKMELFTSFTDVVAKKDAALAAQLQPHVAEFVTDHASPESIPYVPRNEKEYDERNQEIKEKIDDILNSEEFAEWVREKQAEEEALAAAARPVNPANPQQQAAPSPQPSPAPKEKFDICKALRGTATFGPGRSLREQRQSAA